jgi:3-oxoacyl-(acyl-carrier-protein) synthase
VNLDMAGASDPHGVVVPHDEARSLAVFKALAAAGLTPEDILRGDAPPREDEEE